MTGFTTESPSKQFVILAESGRCENLLQALEIRTARGYRVVQCWSSTGGQGFAGLGGNLPMTYVLLQKTEKLRRSSQEAVSAASPRKVLVALPCRVPSQTSTADRIRLSLLP